MSNVGHPNMFPVAGERVVIEASVDSEASTTVEQAAEPSRSIDPWANPIGRLKRAETAKASAAPPAAAKEKRKTRADQVIELLGEHGPMNGARLREALGITAGAGITPYIGSALKSGRILRDGHLYKLPDEAPRSAARRQPDPEPRPTTEALKAEAEAPEPAAEAVLPVPAADVIAPSPERLRETTKMRTPDFTVSAGDAMLIGWPDGSATVQRGGIFVELMPNQVRLLRVFLELRT